MIATMTGSPFLRSLNNGEFRLLWSGQTLSRVGDHLYEIALAWWVLQTTGSAAAMATVLIFAFAPMVLFSLAGGVVVDRYSRVHVMLVTDLVRGLTAAALVIMAVSGGLALSHVYLFSLVMGVAEAFFHPAYLSVLPSVVRETELDSANALTSLSLQAGRIAGPPLGAGLIAMGGIPLAFGLNALSFLAAAALLLPLLVREAGVRAPAEARQSAVSEVREGIGFVAARPWLWAAIAVFALTNITLAGPYAVGLPFLVEARLGGDVGTLGLLYSLFAAGYVAGGLWFGRQKRMKQGAGLLYGGLAVGGLGLAVFALPVGVGVLGLAALANGAALEVSGLAWTGLLQRKVPAEKLGRVVSIDSLGSFALLPVGYGVAGWATGLLGAAPVFLVGGSLTALVALVVRRHPALGALEMIERTR